ncbi:hypothetical protein RSOLAG1IB_05349 [Rhizoctonia solani AG-1 IB]|uniref:Uncharacterized protein n=1 Tax=Thanatephorus cucumeris (strain AG1-IB / isolate 7/3/14) TaxID=1108050 RepID=A0A0B7FZB8_THACB|nr:hypothetical protein RSOLAG1IB_05349 [Rhizoctonia solani AG-1 IB]
MGSTTSKFHLKPRVTPETGTPTVQTTTSRSSTEKSAELPFSPTSVETKGMKNTSPRAPEHTSSVNYASPKLRSSDSSPRQKNVGIEHEQTRQESAKGPAVASSMGAGVDAFAVYGVAVTGAYDMGGDDVGGCDAGGDGGGGE